VWGSLEAKAPNQGKDSFEVMSVAYRFAFSSQAMPILLIRHFRHLASKMTGRFAEVNASFPSAFAISAQVPAPPPDL